MNINVKKRVKMNEKNEKSGQQLPQYKSRLFNNEIINKILSHLSITNKIQLERVSKQFGDCVRDCLQNQKIMKFVNNYNNSCDVYLNYDNNIVINVNRIGLQFNDRNENLVHLLEKCQQLNRLEFDNNIKISHQMIEWICNRCPKLESLSLLDYRCDYHTIDWIRIGDCLANKLICLEIELRLNQQIYRQDLAVLVSKLTKLKELSIMSPRTSMTQIFNNLGPNVTKLRITYSLGLLLDEMNAICSGNGRQLQELVVHYNLCNVIPDQNFVFEMICNNLSALKSFTYNHKSLNDSTLSLISRLKNLNEFNYKFNGKDVTMGSRNSNIWKFFNFRAYESQWLSLKTLTLTNICLIPESVVNLRDLIPNIEKLCLNVNFSCNCSQKAEECNTCTKASIFALSQLKTLRTIHFSNPFIDLVINHLQYFKRITYFEFNIIKCRISLFPLMSALKSLAKNEPKRVITAKLYGIDLKDGLKQIQEPKNLRIINFI